MARALAEKTILTYRMLWITPLASASELVEMAPKECGLTAAGVHNALRAGEKRGWLASVKLGRELRMVNRWLFLETGIAWGESMGWGRDWWHSASGIQELARITNVVESVYRFAPVLPKSNLLRRPLVHTLHYYGRYDSEAEWMPSGWNPVESFWAGARVVDFRWLDEGPFVAAIGYTDPDEPGNAGLPDDPNVLYVPVLHLGRFQKRRDIARLRERLGEALVEREEWRRVPLRVGEHRRQFSGAVALCTDGAAAAIANRFYLETHSDTDNHVAVGIMDIQGNVIRRMDRPSCMWTGIKISRRPRAVGNIGRVVAQLKRGAYASVNGKRAWKIFRTVAVNPGLEARTIAKVCEIDKAEVQKLLRPMVRNESLFCWSQGYYLLDEGERLYGDAEGTTFEAVDERLGRFARIDPGHRRRHRRHDRGLGESLGALREQGITAFVVQGLCIDYYVNGKLRRARPDALVFVAGTVVALEYERSATGTKRLERKSGVYEMLAKIEHPIPVLFVTETESAALLVARSGLAYAAATTLQRLKRALWGMLTRERRAAGIIGTKGIRDRLTTRPSTQWSVSGERPSTAGG